MSSKTLASLAAELAVAPDIDTALRIVNDEFGAEKQVGIALLAFDGRRNTISDRHAVTPPGGTERAQVGIDHLPVAVRYAVLAGQRFADVGEQASQYARLLGIPVEGDDIRLYLKGMVLDGALSGVLAVHERRRRSTGKTAERAEPIAALFEVVHARFYERAARFEAVAMLQEVTDRLRTEHGRLLIQMEQEMAQLRLSSGDVVDRTLLTEFELRADRARQRADAAERRLVAVEEQVSSAVSRLERAHVQIHQQSETLRTQTERIRHLEQELADRDLTARLHPEAQLTQSVASSQTSQTSSRDEPATPVVPHVPSHQ